ncbi:class I SAM-dependent methyltransferase [Chitinimonas naiadis]
MQSRLVGAGGLLLLAAFLLHTPWAQAAEAAAPTATVATQSLQPILSGSWRSEKNSARDIYRHPAETLAFFGVQPNSQLIEITPGGGWYTEILAPWLKQQGSYTAAIVNPDKVEGRDRDYYGKGRSSFQAKLAGDAERYGKVQVREFDLAQPSFGPSASADTVLSFRNVHNWVDAGNEKAYFKAFFEVLKPGGVLGIVDHRAVAGKPLEKSTGYLPEAYVIQLASEAGFLLTGSSEVNANAKDTKDHPKGVWTLPPTLALGEQDKAKYLAIGESDRFTLRFIKPAR